MRNVVLILVAVFQIFGGALGLILLAPALTQGIWPWIFSMPFVLCIVGGIALLRRHRNGRKLSLLAQAFQLPWVSCANFTYRLAAGCALWMSVGTDGLGIRRGTGSSLEWEWASGFGPQFDAHPMVFGLNLVPVIVVVALLWLSSRSSHETLVVPDPLAAETVPI